MNAATVTVGSLFTITRPAKEVNCYISHIWSLHKISLHMGISSFSWTSTYKNIWKREGKKGNAECCSWIYTSQILPLDLMQYMPCSKKDRTFAIKTLLLILHHFKHCPLQSSPLYWRYTVPVSSIVGMLPGTHLLWWRAGLLLHFPESPPWFGNDTFSKWF